MILLHVFFLLLLLSLLLLSGLIFFFLMSIYQLSQRLSVLKKEK